MPIDLKKISANSRYCGALRTAEHDANGVPRNMSTIAITNPCVVSNLAQMGDCVDVT